MDPTEQITPGQAYPRAGPLLSVFGTPDGVDNPVLNFRRFTLADLPLFTCEALRTPRRPFWAQFSHPAPGAVHRSTPGHPRAGGDTVTARRWWVFRLYDSGGECLYVGRTVHHPSRIVRTYTAQRRWGSLIDPRATVMREHASEKAAHNTLARWVAQYEPRYRAGVPLTSAAPAPGSKSLLQRVAAAQARHRALTGGNLRW